MKMTSVRYLVVAGILTIETGYLFVLKMDRFEYTT